MQRDPRPGPATQAGQVGPATGYVPTPSKKADSMQWPGMPQPVGMQKKEKPGRGKAKKEKFLLDTADSTLSLPETNPTTGSSSPGMSCKPITKPYSLLPNLIALYPIVQTLSGF